MKEKYDLEEFYCPKLGHHLHFKYCRTENLGLPCSRLMKCCTDRIPIQKYLNTQFSGIEIQEIFQKPGPKINSILDIVQRVSKDNR